MKKSILYLMITGLSLSMLNSVHAMDPLQDGNILVIDKQDIVFTEIDRGDTVQHYNMYLLTPEGEKILFDSKDENSSFSQLCDDGRLQAIEVINTKGVQKRVLLQEMELDRLSLYFEKGLSFIKEFFSSISYKYQPFDCKKFASFIAASDASGSGLSVGPCTRSYAYALEGRDDIELDAILAGKKYVGNVIYLCATSPDMGKDGTYRANDMLAHYFYKIADDCFLSKFGTYGVFATSMEAITDLYWPEGWDATIDYW